MAMVRTTSKRDARRKSLIRAAIEVIGERGLHESRLSDIGARADISPGQVLYYFESKTDLLIQALCTIEQDLNDDVSSSVKDMSSWLDRWRYLLETAVPLGPGDNRVLLWLEAWELASRDPVVSSRLRQLERNWQALLLQILETGQQSGEIECEDLAAFVVRFSALMDGLTIQVVTSSDAVNREDMLAICWQVTRAALRGPALP